MDAKYQTEPVVTPELQAAINTTGLAPDATWSQKVNALVGNGLTAPLDAAYAGSTTGIVTYPPVDYSANPAGAHFADPPARVSERLAVAQAANLGSTAPGFGAPLASTGQTPVPVVKPAPEVVSSFQCAYCGKTLTFTVSAKA